MSEHRHVPTESEWVHEVLKGWTLFPVREGLDGSQMPMSQQSLELHLGRAVAARVAEARERADAAEAKIAAALVALAMSDHEPTNRVWHEQMQRVRAALGGDAS